MKFVFILIPFFSLSSFAQTALQPEQFQKFECSAKYDMDPLFVSIFGVDFNEPDDYKVDAVDEATAVKYVQHFSAQARGVDSDTMKVSCVSAE